MSGGEEVIGRSLITDDEANIELNNDTRNPGKLDKSEDATTSTVVAGIAVTIGTIVGIKQ